MRIPSTRSTLLRWPFWIGILVSATCVYLVARRVDWRVVAAAISGVNVGWLLIAGGIHVVGTAIAALRWQRLAEHQVSLSYGDAFESLTIGNVTNLLLPSRLGDVLRAVLVARQPDGRVSRMLASLVVERYADVMMLLAFAVALSVAIQFPGPVRLALLILAAVALASLALLYFAADRFFLLVTKAVAFASETSARRLRRTVDGFAEGLAAAGGGQALARTVFLSLIAWSLWGVAAICSVIAVGLEVPWYAGLFVMVVVNLGGLVPASPASIGVYHYLAVLALSVWIQDQSAALGFAVVSHALAVLLTTLLGVWSLTRRGMTLAAVARTGEAVRSLTYGTFVSAPPQKAGER